VINNKRGKRNKTGKKPRPNRGDLLEAIIIIGFFTSGPPARREAFLLFFGPGNTGALSGILLYSKR